MPEEQKRVCRICGNIIYLKSDAYWIKHGLRNSYYCPHCLPRKIERAYNDLLAKSRIYQVDQVIVDKAVKEVIEYGKSIGHYTFHKKGSKG